jgi:transposase
LYVENDAKISKIEAKFQKWKIRYVFLEFYKIMQNATGTNNKVKCDLNSFYDCKSDSLYDLWKWIAAIRIKNYYYLNNEKNNTCTYNKL